MPHPCSLLWNSPSCSLNPTRPPTPFAPAHSCQCVHPSASPVVRRQCVRSIVFSRGAKLERGSRKALAKPNCHLGTDKRRCGFLTRIFRTKRHRSILWVWRSCGRCYPNLTSPFKNRALCALDCIYLCRHIFRPCWVLSSLFSPLGPPNLTFSSFVLRNSLGISRNSDIRRLG